MRNTCRGLGDGDSLQTYRTYTSGDDQKSADADDLVSFEFSMRLKGWDREC